MAKTEKPDIDESELAANDDLDLPSEDETLKADDKDDELPLVTSAHEQMREKMASDIEAFLARGGKIQQVDVNVMADPPRRPQSNYGSRPI